MDGYTANYLFYEKTKRSIITIPRTIIEASDLNWNHQDKIGIIIKNIDGQKGLFLWKRENENENIYED